MPIRVLDAATVGRIAAGEVVERPASVVKELVENSLDAGATSMTIEIKDGGIAYLRVTDNGGGIKPSQVRMAFENHATSKILNADQLSDIRTLGFRGEALPSIAAVSRVEMTTRAKDQDAGVRLTIEGGADLQVREIGCPEGTTVIIKDLFFNLPVRRAFLKKPQYEAALVSDAVARLILGNPKVAFRFISNGRSVYHSFGDGSLRHAVFAVYGRETAENMVEIDSHQGGLRIFGLIGAGDLAKSSRAHEAFFINGRSVRCTMLSQALESALRERVTIGMYPMCALNLMLPPSSVDVNVHPNKLEVRFRDEASTRITAEALLRAAFEGEGMLRSLPEKQAEVREIKTVERLEPQAAEQQRIAIKRTEVEYAQTEVKNKQTEVSSIAKEQTEFSSDELQRKIDAERRKLRVAGGGDASLRERPLPITNPEKLRMRAVEPEEEPAIIAKESATPEPITAPEVPYRLIGVLFRTYILLEWGDSLLMIDQHAAHERLRYEELKRSIEQGVASQRLLAPQIVRVSAREMALIEENADALSSIGYDIAPFGDRDVQIRAVPHILGRADLKPRFLEIVETLSDLGSAALDARREELLQRACKGAVKAGDALTDSEIHSLLRQMQASGAPPTCPHGRPVARALLRREIERMFKRIQ